MAEDQIKAEILAFAAKVGASDKSDEAVAQDRGWLDMDGTPTKEGRDMVAEVQGQIGTRSVFR